MDDALPLWIIASTPGVRPLVSKLEVSTGRHADATALGSDECHSHPVVQTWEVPGEKAVRTLLLTHQLSQHTMTSPVTEGR